MCAVCLSVRVGLGPVITSLRHDMDTPSPNQIGAQFRIIPARYVTKVLVVWQQLTTG